MKEFCGLKSICSIAGKIAFGKNAGKYATKIRSGFGYFEEIPLAKGKRCYSVNGFSLHCNTSVNTHARDLLCYIEFRIFAEIFKVIVSSDESQPIRRDARLISLY